jgi:hypothetical protein
VKTKTYWAPIAPSGDIWTAYIARTKAAVQLDLRLNYATPDDGYTLRIAKIRITEIAPKKRRKGKAK